MKIRVNKKQLETLLETLSEKLKDPRNSEIRESLRRMLDNADLRDLRDAMHLSGYKSIDYSFIKEDILRTQLEVDNMRMEDAAHSTQMTDEERFFIFCINAFYQIENITNYYFAKRFPNFGDLMAYLEAHSNFKHKVNPKTQEIVEKGVGDIDISCKIFALCGELFPSTEDQPDFTYKMINNLRFVRNEGFHRCQVEGKTANEKLEKFYKYNDFNTVRETLRKYVTIIKYELELPQRIEQELEDEYITIPGTGSSFKIEYIETLKKAQLIHVINQNEKVNFWKIELFDGNKKVSFNVHEKFFVKLYGLSDGDNMLDILKYFYFYNAIHRDNYDIWKEANKENKLDSSNPEVMKKYHIVEVIKITEH